MKRAPRVRRSRIKIDPICPDPCANGLRRSCCRPDGHDVAGSVRSAGRTALHRALGGGFHECAELLIEKGADPNVADSLKRTSLHWAAMAPAPGNVPCCELVFAKGDGEGMMAKTTKSGSTPLHSAAGTNRPEAVKFLVSKGADQAAKDEDEMTPYDLAKVSPCAEPTRTHDCARPPCRQAYISQCAHMLP